IARGKRPAPSSASISDELLGAWDDTACQAFTAIFIQSSRLRLVDDRHILRGRAAQKFHTIGAHMDGFLELENGSVEFELWLQMQDHSWLDWYRIAPGNGRRFGHIKPAAMADSGYEPIGGRQAGLMPETLEQGVELAASHAGPSA